MQQHEKYAQAEQGTGSISGLVEFCFWVMQKNLKKDPLMNIKEQY